MKFTHIMNTKNNQRVYNMSFASVYPHYLTKAEKKGRTKEEVDQIIFRLTGYDEKELQIIVSDRITFQDFFENAPVLNPKRLEISGSICGVKIQEIQEPLMKEIRYLDKLVDELTKGRSMDKILRT